MNDNIFETLSKLSRKKESKDNHQHGNGRSVTEQTRKDPSYIFLDENNQIKEIPLSKLDSAGASYINYRTDYKYKNPLKLIHDFIIFGKF